MNSKALRWLLILLMRSFIKSLKSPSPSSPPLKGGELKYPSPLFAKEGTLIPPFGKGRVGGIFCADTASILIPLICI